jgi:hypothetical protein
MVELKHDGLEFSFPEVHPNAALGVAFQRTLRIPDDGSDYPLPPGLGAFPLSHVDDFGAKVPAAWIEHGGVMLPMYQAEAMWLNFQARHDDERDCEYPCAIMVAAGTINAVSGSPWTNQLGREPQNYLVAPDQPWLDGFCIERGVIRQFVAMPLGDGYSAEEQITGKAEHGGLQLMVVPMKRNVYERRFPKVPHRRWQGTVEESGLVFCCCAGPEMGLAPGGRMRQEIYNDPYDLADWDIAAASRCFVHIVNSCDWCRITERPPPTTPPTARQYAAARLPWFDYSNATGKAVAGSAALAGLKSVAEMGKAKRQAPLPENDSVPIDRVVTLRAGLRPGQVREFQA